MQRFFQLVNIAFIVVISVIVAFGIEKAKAASSKQMTIAMILWRGETASEREFRKTLEKQHKLFMK